MKITDAIAELKGKTLLCCEVFPPKNNISPLTSQTDVLVHYQPDFLSVTHGADGSNVGEQERVLNTLGSYKLTNMIANYTCINKTSEKMRNFVKTSIRNGIENFIFLRGDYPEGTNCTNGNFAHACDMISYAKYEIPDICIGAAAYPNMHIESKNWNDEKNSLKKKAESGTDFFVTQMSFDIYDIMYFIDNIGYMSIKQPFIIGVMPVLSIEPIVKMSLKNGVPIPKQLSRLMGKYYNDPDSFKKAGIEYTVNFIKGLKSCGINAFQIFTMNNSEDLRPIINEVRG